MIKIHKKDGKVVMESDSKFGASLFLTFLLTLTKLVDGWLIMIFLGVIHHIFNTEWMPPSFWLSVVISLAITGVKKMNETHQKALKDLGF